MVQNALKTHFLNVSNNGMGNCTIIELPDNQRIHDGRHCRNG